MWNKTQEPKNRLNQTAGAEVTFEGPDAALTRAPIVKMTRILNTDWRQLQYKISKLYQSTRAAASTLRPGSARVYSRINNTVLTCLSVACDEPCVFLVCSLRRSLWLIPSLLKRPNKRCVKHRLSSFFFSPPRSPFLFSLRHCSSLSLPPPLSAIGPFWRHCRDFHLKYRWLVCRVSVHNHDRV